MNALNSQIEHKLSEIHDCIKTYIESQLYLTSNEPLGLFTGDFGIFLFNVLYNSQTLKKTKKIKDNHFIKTIFTKWTTNPYYHTYCSGSSGILDMLLYLTNTGVYKTNLNDYIYYFNKHLSKKIEEDMLIGNFDFLHAALGPAFFILNQNTELEIIYNFIEQLDRISIKHKKYVKWVSIIDKERKGYNISLSHGMSSILIFLLESQKKGINNNTTKHLINGTINYILDQKKEIKSENGSIFASTSKENESELVSGRLGWCYGDLGIAIAMWQAFKISNSTVLKRIAEEIIINTSQRRDLASNFVRDAGICHGTAGIAMVFHYFGEETGLNEAWEAYYYWLNETLKMSKFEDGLAGYKTYISETEIKNDYSLLLGISGIGLVLLSELTNNFSWQRFFLLK